MVTIAICAVIPEGVVFGADSTSTRTTSDGAQRYLDNEQKVFEVGEGSTFGVLTWGLGQVGDISHRTRVALLADDLEASPPKTVKEAAGRFANQLWAGYEQAYRVEIDKQKAIQADPNVPKQDKDRASSILQSLAFGFCIAGRAQGSRTPEAYEINVDSSLTTAPQPQSIAQVKSWGANLFIFRALGVATNPCGDILATGKWGGTPAELANALTAGATPLQLPMPLRETIDAVHCLLQMTIKFMKFTSLPPTCGGSIELATVTSDRRFRWVRHKRLSAALSTGEFHEQ